LLSVFHRSLALISPAKSVEERPKIKPPLAQAKSTPQDQAKVFEAINHLPLGGRAEVESGLGQGNFLIPIWFWALIAPAGR